MLIHAIDLVKNNLSKTAKQRLIINDRFGVISAIKLELLLRSISKVIFLTIVLTENLNKKRAERPRKKAGKPRKTTKRRKPTRHRREKPSQTATTQQGRKPTRAEKRDKATQNQKPAAQPLHPAV